MVGEFKSFLVKQGVLGLAVAVVIGGAVTKLVAAIVADLIMPIVGAAVPSGDWRKAAVEIGNVKFLVGDFAGVLLDFLIVALVVFLMVRKLIKEPPPETEKA